MQQMKVFQLINNRGQSLEKQSNLSVSIERLNLFSKKLNHLKISRTKYLKKKRNHECITFAKSTCLDIRTKLKQSKRITMNRSCDTTSHAKDSSRCELLMARISKSRCLKEWPGLNKFKVSWPR